MSTQTKNLPSSTAAGSLKNINVDIVTRPKNNILIFYIDDDVVDATDSSVFYSYDENVNADLERSLDRLDELAALEENWNFNDAPRFKESLIEKVRNFVIKLEHQPMIFPTARESIQLEFRNLSGHYLELEIFENEFSVFFKKGDITTETDFTDETKVIHFISNFHHES